MLCQAMIERSGSLAWNPPSQARSRAKVEALLSAARELCIAQGHPDVKMTEVASRAGVAIGSLYQFFPTRSALLAELYAREMEPIDQSMKEALVTADTLRDIENGILDLLTKHLQLVRSKPALFVLLTSPQVDPAIQRADFKNTEKNATVLAERMISLVGKDSECRAIKSTSVLICHLWSSVIRLCIMTEETEASTSLIDQYSKMIKSHIADICS